MYILFINFIYVHTTMLKYTGGTWIGDALVTGTQAPAGTCKLMNNAIWTNCIKQEYIRIRVCTCMGDKFRYFFLPWLKIAEPCHFTKLKPYKFY